MANELNEDSNFTEFLGSLIGGKFEREEYKEVMDFMIHSRNKILEELKDEGHSGSSWGLVRQGYGKDQFDKLFNTGQLESHPKSLFSFACKIAVLDAFCAFDSISTIKPDMGNNSEWIVCSGKNYEKTTNNGRTLFISETTKQSCLHSAVFLYEISVIGKDGDPVTISYMTSVDGSSYSDDGYIFVTGSQGSIPLQITVSKTDMTDASSCSTVLPVLKDALSEDFSSGSFDEMKLKAARAFSNKINNYVYENKERTQRVKRTISELTPTEESLSELYGYSVRKKFDQILEGLNGSFNFDEIDKAVNEKFRTPMEMASKFQKMVKRVNERTNLSGSELHEFIYDRLCEGVAQLVCPEDTLQKLKLIQGLVIDLYLNLLQSGRISVKSIDWYTNFETPDAKTFLDYCLNVAAIVFSMQLAKNYLGIDRVLTQYSSKTFVETEAPVEEEKICKYDSGKVTGDVLCNADGTQNNPPTGEGPGAVEYTVGFDYANSPLGVAVVKQQSLTKEEVEEIWNGLKFSAEDLNGKTSQELNQLTRFALAQAIERHLNN